MGKIRRSSYVETHKQGSGFPIMQLIKAYNQKIVRWWDLFLDEYFEYRQGLHSSL